MLILQLVKYIILWIFYNYHFLLTSPASWADAAITQVFGHHLLVCQMH